ncbi:MAG: NAD-dependent epimerase/dehydratase family protein [Clostridia bacterium]|nr:NAD-dependent epimerase/dehydratase family protein [Clostridia bacterium]
MIYASEYPKELCLYVRENKELFESLKGQKIAITGAAGLIGSYIIDLIIVANEELGTGIEVLAIDRNRELLNSRFPEKYTCVRHYAIDVNEAELPKERVDYVIHAASNTSPIDYATKPIDTMKTNFIGTDRMINFCMENGAKRFVFCSSVEAYGVNNGDVDEFCEDYSGYVNCNTVRAGYPSAKRASEALCNAYCSQLGLDFVTARIGRIYGPTVIEGDTKAPTQFINNAVNGEDIVMKSNGMQEFSYGYVGDCATAMLLIMKKGVCGEAYNIADPNSRVLLRDFAESSASAGNAKVVFCAPTETEAKGYSKVTKAVMNTDKLVSLGWSAKYNVKAGVERTVKYLKEIKGV